MAEFPNSIPTNHASSTSEYLSNMASGFGHVALHNFEVGEIIALATKLGTGSSTPSSGLVLRGTGTGTSAWGQIDLANDLAAFTSLQLAGRLSDETGSGSSVFGTSPTLSTPTITGGGSWAGSPTLSTPTIASFTNAQHDHSNAAGGGSLGSSVVTGTNIASYKILRQDNTSNSTETAAKQQSGEGFIVNDTGANTISETVTFPSAFSFIPIVVATFGGDHGSSTTYGAGGNNVSGRVHIKAHTISTTGFTVQLHNGEGVNFSSGNSFYQWIAIGN